jgi:DNA-directed RNA polymerase II subunit RPB1
VATLMDNEIQGQPTHKHRSGKPLKAIRARLRGKEGRLRGNLMGKRVDFSSRSVITPDPILKLDQLGVPVQIALNLTVPETVTAENIDEMKRLVHNGPNNWPGAKYIIRPDSHNVDLSSLRNRSDAYLEPGYKVERHLKNDDYVIFNRQPSLHKMSLMGHRVKVLPYSTFRLNLSVTTPYNADFDGDEMNMHVPQSYETMAEIKEIMAVPYQIVSPKDNKPVMGIVQDALLGVMLFTLRDTFIEKELVMNLLMWANYEDDKFPQPAIIKPKPLWTGKQIFSLIIPKINMEKMGGKTWCCPGDKNILIKEGELLCGNLTKGTIGSSSGGMIHIIWKEKGPYPTRDFMSNTQLMINNWLHQNGFTVGVQDIIAKKSTLDSIKENLKKK